MTDLLDDPVIAQSRGELTPGARRVVQRMQLHKVPSIKSPVNISEDADLTNVNPSKVCCCSSSGADLALSSAPLRC